MVKESAVSPESYEKQDGKHLQHFPFFIQKTIEQHGGVFKTNTKHTPHMEVDGRVITGQNHLSCKMVAQKVLEVLKNQSSK